MLDSLYKPIADLILNRYPIKISASGGGDPATVILTITNQTPELPVFIHDVRVHFGFEERSRAFSFIPHSTTELRPKEKKEWRLSYESNETKIVVRFLSKDPTDVGSCDSPGIESPAQLFNAIRKGGKKHSWVEVDFNEYTQRQFLRGKIKNVFDMVGRIHESKRNKRKKTERKFLLHLPDGGSIEISDFDSTLGQMISIANEALNDNRITPDEFGIGKYFFFVNRSTGSLIDSVVSTTRPLSTLFIEEGNVVELCLRNPRPQPDGTVLNPMFGVTKFVK